MSIIISASKNGKNVLEIINPNDFIFKSNLNTLKIIKEGLLTGQTVSGDPTTFTIPHYQLITPLVFGFAKFADGYVALPGDRPRDGGFWLRYWLLEVDNTNIYFRFYLGGTANYNVDIKWYIFETSVNTA